MFRVGEEYVTKSGLEAVVIMVDAPTTYSNKKCPVLAMVKLAPGCAQSHAAYPFSEDGRYLGTGNMAYDLVPNEPNEEEAKLMEDIKILAADGFDRGGREKRLLKIIRQLRKR